MGEAASCADGARPSRVYSSPDPRQRDPRSLRALTGEVILSEFKNGSADVLISSKRMKLLEKSMRKSHFEGAVARSEFSRKFRRKSK